MNYRTKDNLAVVGGILAVLLVVALLVGGVWLRVAAPCKYVTWMPLKDTPSRCLTIGRN